MKYVTRFLVTLMCVCCATHLQAGEDRPVALAGFLIDIDEVDSVNQSFTINFFLEARWHDTSQAHEGEDSISKDLDDIWYPQLQILNEQSLRTTFPRMAEIRPDGEVIYRQRFWGKLSQPLELRAFPFDSQRLEITLVGLAWGSVPYSLNIDPESRLSESLRIPDWEIQGWEFVPKNLPIGRHGSDVSAAVFSVDVKRETAFFALKVITPLLLIVAMSWLVLWLDPGLAAPRISVAVTTMLTLIAYRFAIGSMVPRLPFLTTLDYFVLASTVLVFLSLATVIWSTRMNSNGQKEAALALDRRARWITPILYVLLLVETLYLHIFI
jgi:hypothetical protein